MKVLKAFNSVNRRFAVGQALTAADLAGLDVDALKERGCIGTDEPKVKPRFFASKAED